MPWGKVGKILEAGWNAIKAVDRLTSIISKAQGVLRRVQAITEQVTEAATEQFQKLLSRGGGCNSFAPGTLVLMADGSTKPIEELSLDDQVMAYDPDSGVSGGRQVVGTVVGEGVKHLVRIALDIDGPEGDATGVVVATGGHPFWLADEKRWRNADELRVGSLLQSPDGSWTEVVSVERWFEVARVHNLTIDDIHTFYVVTEGVGLLSHNANSAEVCHLTLGPDREQQVQGVAAERGDRVLPHEQVLINEFGDTHGCWSCPARESGYADGHWTGDHIPPNKLAPEGPWTIYPHCMACARRQGGMVNGVNRGFYDRFDNE
ncbi:Hint domain-containing protein [Saccharothrix syringae]|uniref:Hint domain-containing protein n=1 Tax=Saccharothrix syringae TaxID=103733 RepID=UPI000A0517C2|nr:Hint domain-containing protein [Saccharothrix syringae]